MTVEADDKLNSWKEIASFLGRDERTAKRWEATRHLPVRRAPGGRSTVFAYRHELEAWLRQGRVYGVAAGTANDDTASALPPASPFLAAPALAVAKSPAATATRRRLWPWAALVAAPIIAASLLTLPNRPHRAEAAATPPDLYLKGVYSWNARTRAGLSDAIADFSQVILERPDYAPAYAGLADAYNLMPEFGGMSPAEAYPQAKVAAERAVALDDRLCGAHLALAFVDFWWTHDVAASGHEFERAIGLDPNAAVAHHWYANTLAMQGEIGHSLAEILLAERLDPASTAIRADKANLLYTSGHTAEAVELLTAIARARPDYAPTHSYLARIYFAVGRPVDEVAELTRAAKLADDPVALSVAVAAGNGLRRGGVAAMRQAVRDRQQALYDQGAGSPYALAQSYASQDANRTFSMLDASLRQGESAIMGLKGDLQFRPVRADPRFAALLARLHLNAGLGNRGQDVSVRTNDRFAAVAAAR
jgi:hypothetical protein